MKITENDPYRDQVTRLHHLLDQEAQREVTNDRKGKSQSHIEARKRIERGLAQEVAVILHHTNVTDVIEDIKLKVSENGGYQMKRSFKARLNLLSENFIIKLS